MAAQGSSKCDKCFATIPPGAATCPDCGAPVGNASTADTEAGVYPDLAKANLARMRGDYKQAEDQLLSVLKRFPNNPSANEMLGDLAAEREDWPHAIQWYEMALEIVPTSASIARKVKDARAKIEKKDAQDTTAQLGLPDPSSRMPMLIGGIILLVLVVAAGAYYIGAKGGGKPPASQSPQVLTAQPPTTSNATSGGDDGGTTVPQPAAGIAEEQALQQSLAKAEDASLIVSVSHDPRTNRLIVTYTKLGAGDEAVAARLARDAFAVQPGYNTVTLRGVSEGKIVFMADADRSRMAETQTPEWKQAHADQPDAWTAYVLQNIWPSGTGTNQGTPTNPTVDTAGGTGSTGTIPPPPTDTAGGVQ